MRVLHTESSCGWGGQEIRILDEAQGMSSRGHEVVIVAPRESRIYEAALERGVRVEALPIAGKNLSGLLAMRRWLKAHPVDVVNSHSSTDSWLAALACATLARAPALVRTRHVSAAIPNNLPTRWLYRRATLHVVTTGEALRLQLLRDNGLSPEHVTSVPTGIDTGRFVPGDREAARRLTGLPSGRRLIGIVATLRSWKGHRYLIEAVNGLPPDVGLVIVGDGPQRRNIESSIRELGMSERVWLVGNQCDVLPWLQSLDVFALPSYANARQGVDHIREARLRRCSARAPLPGPLHPSRCHQQSSITRFRRRTRDLSLEGLRAQQQAAQDDPCRLGVPPPICLPHPAARVRQDSAVRVPRKCLPDPKAHSRASTADGKPQTARAMPPRG